ncbi:MAG: hypothetical protein JSS07_05110 [Proteobacteria bacterium]|nr:hypothetical protein [Pseudomonadota bacterium]
MLQQQLDPVGNNVDANADGDVVDRSDDACLNDAADVDGAYGDDGDDGVYGDGVYEDSYDVDGDGAYGDDGVYGDGAFGDDGVYGDDAYGDDLKMLLIFRLPCCPYSGFSLHLVLDYFFVFVFVLLFFA